MERTAFDPAQKQAAGKRRVFRIRADALSGKNDLDHLMLPDAALGQALEHMLAPFDAALPQGLLQTGKV